MEMDFYTAVDELQPKEETGAGMMGFTGYDSACFYRYARLDWGQLTANLAGDAELAQRTVKGFLHAAIEAVPSGKQNTFAANNPPSLIFATVRSGGMGWSLANAFERPVNADRQGGYVAASARALDECWSRLCTAFGEHTVAGSAVLALDSELPLAKLAERQVSNLDAFVDRVLSALPAQGGAA
jgi:CRISPR system Cascade subunit CasC